MSVRTLTNNAGFTFIELLVSVVLFSILAGIAIPMSYSFYTSYTYRSEEQLFIELIREARNAAFAREHGADHGLYIDATNDLYILFVGDSYATRVTAYDEPFDKSSNITITGASEIVFDQSDGTTTATSFTLDNNTRSTTISVNSHGTITKVDN